MADEWPPKSGELLHDFFIQPVQTAPGGPGPLAHGERRAQRGGNDGGGHGRKNPEKLCVSLKEPFEANTSIDQELFDSIRKENKIQNSHHSTSRHISDNKYRQARPTTVTSCCKG